MSVPGGEFVITVVVGGFAIALFAGCGQSAGIASGTGGSTSSPSQRWVGLDRCSTATRVEGECTYYTTCSAGVEVGLCVKQGGGHALGDANIGGAFLSKFTLP